MAVLMAQAPYPRWRQLPGCWRVRGVEGHKTGKTTQTYRGATILLLGYDRTARPCSMVKGLVTGKSSHRGAQRGLACRQCVTAVYSDPILPPLVAADPGALSDAV